MSQDAETRLPEYEPSWEEITEEAKVRLKKSAIKLLKGLGVGTIVVGVIALHIWFFHSVVGVPDEEACIMLGVVSALGMWLGIPAALGAWYDDIRREIIRRH